MIKKFAEPAWRWPGAVAWERLAGGVLALGMGAAGCGQVGAAAEPDTGRETTVSVISLGPSKTAVKSSEPRRGSERPGSGVSTAKPASVEASAPAEKLADRPGALRGKELYQRLLRSTAWIAVNLSGDWERFSWGTAWVLDRERKRLITNHHVVSDGKTVHKDDRIRVCFPEYQEGLLQVDRAHYVQKATAYKARVFDTDAQRDLAVVELEAFPSGVEPLTLATEAIAPGEAVYQLGNPGASDAMWVFTSGTVRQVYRGQTIYDNGQFCDFLRVETQSPINPGDSGGPVVNERGELVAITSGTSGAGQLMTYFVDVSELKSYLQEIAPLAAPKTAEEFNKRGDHYYERGRYDRALADFTEAIRLNPKFPEAIANRGWTLNQLEDYDTALADFDEAIQQNPSDPTYYQGRGLVYQARKEYEKAIGDLTQAIRRKPEEAEYYGDRGGIQADREEYDSAVKDYTRAIELAPDTADYYNARGDCRFSQEKHEQAADDYSEAIKRAPEEALYYYNRGCAFHKRRDLQRAALDFQRMEQLDPRFAEGQVQELKTRLLKLTNATDERLTVWLKYHTLDDQGDWDWYPSAPGKEKWLKYTFAPRESAYISDDGFQIHADRVRIAAYNEDKSQAWEGYEKDDLILAEDEYSAYQMGTIEFTFK